MQDSIEDYIRISKNTLTGNERISKEILTTAQRKKECEAYAMKIVMFLIDGKLRTEIFLKCLKYINPDYYQDVVEERALSKLCGYPLCSKKIPDMPKQRYFISTKVNKVYDISERKNYCSNFCYNGSLHIKNQIDSSPLWLRNHKDMVECNLLPATAGGLPGEEIDQGVAKPAPELPLFTSISHFTQISLEEASQIEKNSAETDKYKKTYKIKQKQKSSLNVIKEDDMSNNETESQESEFEYSDNSDDEYSRSKNIVEDSNKKMINSKTLKKIELSKDKCNENNSNEEILRKQTCVTKIEEIRKGKETKLTSEKEKLEYLISKLKISKEPKTKLVDPQPIKILQKTNAAPKPKIQKDKRVVKKDKLKIEPITVLDSIKEEPVKPVSDDIQTNNEKDDNEILDNLKKCIEEWLTVDTFIFIYGENRVKQVLNENKMGEYFEKLKINQLETEQQLKYVNVCRKLQLQELAEEKFDNAILGRSLKPLPDFKQIKEEVQELDLKVRSYYRGMLYETPDTNFPTKSVKENIEKRDEDTCMVLPLVDVGAQNALRRKVFLNSINKILKKLISELKLSGSEVLSDIHDLVKSFKLQAHNTVFKPKTWILITVILIKMLSLKDFSIKNQLKHPRSEEHLDLLLSRYVGVEKTIEEIFALLGDIDRFVEIYITRER